MWQQLNGLSNDPETKYSLKLTYHNDLHPSPMQILEHILNLPKLKTKQFRLNREYHWSHCTMVNGTILSQCYKWGNMHTL